MKEIEILFSLNGIMEKALHNVAQIAEIKKQVRVIDTYYTRNDIKELLPDSDGRLLASFRIRTKGETNYITYKYDHFDELGTWLYSDESETTVGNADTIVEIFSKLGFIRLVVIDNMKHIFLNKEYEIVIEEVKDLGNFIEIEYIGSEIFDTYDAVANKNTEMRAYLALNNIEVGAEMNAGKPELMLRKLGEVNGLE